MLVVEERPEVVAIPALGDRIIFASEYTGFKTDAFDGQFAPFSSYETKKMKKGQVVYMNLDALYPMGGITGRVKVRITNIVACGPNGTYTEHILHFEGGGFTGSRTTKRGTCKELMRAVDEEGLVKIMERLPLSRNPFPPRT